MILREGYSLSSAPTLVAPRPSTTDLALITNEKLNSSVTAANQLASANLLLCGLCAFYYVKCTVLGCRFLISDHDGFQSRLKAAQTFELAIT